MAGESEAPFHINERRGNFQPPRGPGLAVEDRHNGTMSTRVRLVLPMREWGSELSLSVFG